MSRSTPARAAAWRTLARASRLGRSRSSHGGELVGVGRQVDDRVDAVEVGDPVVVELGEVGRDHVGVVRRRPRRRAGRGRRRRPRRRGACGRCCPQAPVIRTVRGSSSQSVLVVELVGLVVGVDDRQSASWAASPTVEVGLPPRSSAVTRRGSWRSPSRRSVEAVHRRFDRPAETASVASRRCA